MPARTRQDPQKNNRAALALARKAISTFSGELAAPIVVVEEEMMGLLSHMFADEESRRRRAAKFEAVRSLSNQNDRQGQVEALKRATRLRYRPWNAGT
jgi:hypothetical protein